MLFALFACASDILVSSVTPATGEAEYEALEGYNLSFALYNGTLVDYPAPEKLIGYVWKRDIECFEEEQDSGCGFIPNEVHFPYGSLEVETQILQNPPLVDAYISSQDGLNSGLFQMLSIPSSSETIVHMLAEEQEEQFVQDTDANQLAIQTFAQEHFLGTEELAFTFFVKHIKITTKSYQFYGFEPEGADGPLIRFGADAYYEYTQGYQINHIYHITLQPLMQSTAQ